MADKDTAWLLSRRLRAYISIIKSNCFEWIQIILNEFDIYDNDLSHSQKNRKKKNYNKSYQTIRRISKKKCYQKKSIKSKI